MINKILRLKQKLDLKVINEEEFIKKKNKIFKKEKNNSIVNNTFYVNNLKGS